MHEPPGRGGIAFFNDAAFGIAPDAVELERYAAALGVGHDAPAQDGKTLQSPSGYVRASRGRMLALLDVAPVGPGYLPGHAHADSLSFELSVHGRRARPFDVKVSADEVEAAHAGYTWLSGRPLHRRARRFEDDALEVDDSVFG